MVGASYAKAFALLLVLAPEFTSAISPISDVFVVDFTTSDNGGCQPYQSQLQGAVWDDVGTLANAGVALVNAYQANPQDPVAQRLMLSYFHFPAGANANNAAALTMVLDFYTHVRDFVNGQLSIPTGKPYLYCDSTWLNTKYQESPYLNPKDGKEVQDKNGDTVTIAAAIKQKLLPELEISPSSGKKQRYYYAPEFKIYLADEPYGGSRKNPRGYCDASDSQGVTQDFGTPQTTVTLCPRSFAVYQARNLNTGNAELVANINNPARQPLVSGDDRNAGVVAITLFHELFHLVEGPSNTPPNGAPEIYGLQDLLANAMTRDFATTNPESYTLAALAWYYAANTQTPMRADYSTGYGLAV